MLQPPEDSPLPSQVEIVRSPSARLVQELALVLQSMQIPFRSEQGPAGFSLIVPAPLADRALDELARYQRENRNWPPPRAKLSPPKSGGTIGVLLYAIAIVLMFRFQRAEAFGLDWVALGRSDGAALRAGELWRGLTALTLHADLVHLASNLVFGAGVGLLLAAVHGPGLAWTTILLAGWLGNLVNAAAQGFANASIGASTAVFAGLGALAAAQSIEKLRLGHGALARLAPVLAAALLLSWHGMGGAHIAPGRGLVIDPADRTDIGAHLFGFAAGLLLGGALALWEARRGIDPRVRWTADVVALALLPLAWLAALAWR